MVAKCSLFFCGVGVYVCRPKMGYAVVVVITVPMESRRYFHEKQVFRTTRMSELRYLDIAN